MTYKNIKFSESDVMAEFEKIAKTKGLIKEQVIVKKASKDLDITDSLDVNISKLIMALAESGDSVLANELAKKYSNYKRDDVLVKNAEKDKMKELYDSAHDGSVKMDKDPESVVEDLYDVHDRMMEIASRVKLKKKAQSIINNGDDTLKQFKNYAEQQYLSVQNNVISSLNEMKGDISQKKEVLSISQIDSGCIRNSIALIDYTINQIKENKGLLNLELVVDKVFFGMISTVSKVRKLEEIFNEKITILNSIFYSVQQKLSAIWKPIDPNDDFKIVYNFGTQFFKLKKCIDDLRAKANAKVTVSEPKEKPNTSDQSNINTKSQEPSIPVSKQWNTNLAELYGLYKENLTYANKQPSSPEKQKFLAKLGQIFSDAKALFAKLKEQGDLDLPGKGAIDFTGQVLGKITNASSLKAAIEKIVKPALDKWE